MFRKTLETLRCPHPTCKSPLKLGTDTTAPDEPAHEILYGELECRSDQHRFPILDGVAILVPEYDAYLQRSAPAILKSIDPSKVAKDILSLLESGTRLKDRPGAWRDSDFNVGVHIAHHYLRDKAESKLAELTHRRPILELLRQQWNEDPVTHIDHFLTRTLHRKGKLLELGCSVGGAIHRLGKHADQSLGLDVSFGAIHQARKLLTQSDRRVLLPADRLHGSLSEAMNVDWQGPTGGSADFVVANIFSPPLAFNDWDAVIALGVLDIADNPKSFAHLQCKLTAPGGYVIEGSPYRWTEESAKALRSVIPPHIHSSEDAVKWLYEQENLQTIESQDDIPWLYFKGDRWVDLSAMHLLYLRKPEKKNE